MLEQIRGSNQGEKSPGMLLFRAIQWLSHPYRCQVQYKHARHPNDRLQNPPEYRRVFSYLSSLGDRR